MRFLVVFLLLFFFAGASSCSHVVIDKAQGALVSYDYTGLIDGCGKQLDDGFCVVRKTEGDAAQDNLYFVGPPVKCKNQDNDHDGKPDPCITFKIFFTDGSGPAYGGAIPNGQTRVAIPWKFLLHSDTYQPGHRGFWGFSYNIRFTDPNGVDQTFYTQGEIYLRVVAKGYVSLHNVPVDPNFSWGWIENGAVVKMTTTGRTYVSDR